MSDLRTVVADHWAALESAPRSTNWLTSALPVEAGDAPVLCAVAPDGKRHLLVPVPADEAVRADVRAAAVHLVPLALEADARRRDYADLVLLREDLVDIFTGLCADVIAALAAELAPPLVLVSQVLDGWHELFRSGSQLGIEQLAGLFGELLFLNELLDLGPGLIHAWQGPLRAAHDFVVENRAVEVKATAAAEGRSVRIHGLDQLTIPPGGDLMVRWLRLDTADGAGASLPDLVESTTKRLDLPRELWQLLARAGYLIADGEKYTGIRFTVVEEASYRVGDSFPRIVPASFTEGVPAGISAVRYTLDLDLAPAPMQKAEIAEFMKAMTRR
jgi:hypothetical protein